MRTVGKGVFVDNHGRKDVVKQRKVHNSFRPHPTTELCSPQEFCPKHMEYYKNGPNWYHDLSTDQWIDKDLIDDVTVFDALEYFGLGGAIHPDTLERARYSDCVMSSCVTQLCDRKYGEPIYIMFLHDESTCRTNDSHKTFWSDETYNIMVKKNEGAALMVSGYACEIFNGTISRTDCQPRVSSMQHLLHPDGPELDVLVEQRVQDGEWEIESILDKRQNKGQIEYLVKWLGYSEDDNNWEPVGHLEGSEGAIADYERTEHDSQEFASDIAEHADFVLRVGKADAAKHIASGKDGYWNNGRFRHQQMHFLDMFAQRVAEVEKLLSKKLGFDIKLAAVLTYDHSSGHTAMAEDAQDAKNLNKGPGGKKGTMMRDTRYKDTNGKNEHSPIALLFDC